MDLRSKLVQLTLAAALPPIVLCLLLGAMLVNYEREALTRGAIDRNRAFMTAVDAEIRVHLPAALVMGLVDENGYFIARLPPRSATEFASDGYRTAVRATREGWFRGATVEGNDTFSAHKTSELTNWSVGLDIPIAEVNAA